MILGALGLTIFELGFIAPVLISAESTELVLGGLISIAIYLPTMYYIIRAIIKAIKSKLNKLEEEV